MESCGGAACPCCRRCPGRKKRAGLQCLSCACLRPTSTTVSARRMPDSVRRLDRMVSWRGYEAAGSAFVREGQLQWPSAASLPAEYLHLLAEVVQV